MVYQEKYNSKYSEDQNDEKNIAYDLRQIYAKLVGQHMVEITINRKAQNFYYWLKALEDLYTITSFKFNDKEDKKKRYEELKNDVVELSNRYNLSWSRKSNDPHEVNTIDKSLRELEEFIYESMEDGGIFGKGYSYDEDEI